jgi:hypothetical protein
MRLLFAVIFSIFIINGCGSVKYSSLHKSSDFQKIKRLKQELSTLSNNKTEVNELAMLAIVTPRELANRYNLVSPPQYHNFLVNSGQRSRGLCYHFVEDIQHKINQRDFKSFSFRWGVANQNRLNEHNVIVVMPKSGGNFGDGIILDGWRNSGELYFGKVKDDSEYKFVEWQEGDRMLEGF